MHSFYSKNLLKNRKKNSAYVSPWVNYIKLSRNGARRLVWRPIENSMYDFKNENYTLQHGNNLKIKAIYDYQT